MSTKCSIKWRDETDDAPGFHLYEDCLDHADEGKETPVYLRLDGVQVDLATRHNGGSVTIQIPREAARALGLVDEKAGTP